LALLEDPYETVEKLAPFAVCVHLKDMAVQPFERGFLLSEVTCGTGCLDLVRITKMLLVANPSIHFSLEMATRDPLIVPCLEDTYWVTFPERRSTHLDQGMRFVQSHPIANQPPRISGKPLAQQLSDEEGNNRASLLWMKGNI
ncbi:MAG: hypothetical protein ABL921_33275, partial [Pirellula sp.]